MTAKRENQYRQLGLTIAYYRKLHGITADAACRGCQLKPHPYQQHRSPECAHFHLTR